MATKKVADATLYHLSPKGFWKKFRDVVSVNPAISSGLPVPSLNRHPQPASRPEKYATPATKASDPAHNPYWKRDVRRAYPQLSVITQTELSSLLIQHSDANAPTPSATRQVREAPPHQLDLSEAIASIARTELYTESRLPPTLPTPHKPWQHSLVQIYINSALMSFAPPTTEPGSSTEVQAAAFADDPRIYFSKTTKTWRYEDDDGMEMEFDAGKGLWVPELDEDLVIQQQAAYSVFGVDEAVPAAPVLRRENKKRKEREDYTAAGPSIKKGKNEKLGTSAGEKKSKNTAVFVTGLPADTDMEELVDRFSKCGVIEEDDEGEPKVKMYARDDGTFSGEALVVYFKEDSVTLALNLLDEAELRLGDSSTVMSVQKADFAHKHTHIGGNEQRRTIDKKKASRRIGKMQKKLQDWDDADGFGPTIIDDSALANRTSRVVVLKHMFTLQELEEDASLLLDLKEDVREECSMLGEVTSVVLYDQEFDGIITVKFRDPLSAQACVLRMNGRYFAGRRVEAFIYYGKQRFRRSGAEEPETNTEEAEKKRLDDFANWLMSEGD
ncbi:hypothetical protein APHAL10511_004945 [Amanita phalloides]|nr:hypothetical protein APHAL10511_004945 [Amanita phalloides]